MKIELNIKDKNKFNELYNQKLLNMTIDDMYNEFLFYFDVREANKYKNVSEYFNNYFDLDSEDITVINQYNSNNFKLLNINDYLENQYYKDIIIDAPIKFKNYELCYEKYGKSSLFYYDNIKVDENNYKEITPIGYFLNDYKYLCLKKDNITWMSITPHEINTMKYYIEQVKGNVLVLGLGLGYFPYMISQKDEVKQIDIIELDKNVIEIFNSFLKPKFNYINKINIINQDMFKYVKEHELKNYSYIFCDVYHDNLDGLEIYLKLKSLEKYLISTRVFYWIEETFICNIRRIMLDLFYESINNISSKESYENKVFDELFNKLSIYFKDLKIDSYDQIHNLLKDDSIKEIVTKLDYH